MTEQLQEVVVQVRAEFKDKRIGRNRTVGERMRETRETADRWVRQGLVLIVEANPDAGKGKPKPGPPENKQAPPLESAPPAPNHLGPYAAELGTRKHAELVELAESKGLKFDKSKNKAHLVGRLVEHREKMLEAEAEEAAEEAANKAMGTDEDSVRAMGADQ